MRPSEAGPSHRTRACHSSLAGGVLIVLSVAAVCGNCALGDLNEFLKEPIENREGRTGTGGVWQMIEYSQDTLTLAWDPPVCDPEDPPIRSYVILYRGRDGLTWKEFAAVDAAPAPECAIQHSELGDGEYVFGVMAVSTDDLRSDVHSSLDATAEPATGWYVKWHVH